MAFDLRAPVPIRFQRYISNTPVWEAGETYLAGDIVKYVIAGTDLAVTPLAPTDTLYIALVDATLNNLAKPPHTDAGFWRAAAAGDTKIEDIVLPGIGDVSPIANASAFRVAIGANFETRVAGLETADGIQDGLIGANLNANLANVLDANYATVPTAAQDAFKLALDIQGAADAVTDEDVFLEGTTLPAGASAITISHMMVNGVIHPLGGVTDEVPAGIFAYNFNGTNSAVQGSDDDTDDTNDLTSVLTITTADPHVITEVSAVVSAPAGATLPAFPLAGTDPIMAVVAAGGASAVFTQDLLTADIRDYTWMVTVSYTTSGGTVTTAERTETVSINAASVASGTLTFAPTTIIHGGPDGALVGTLTYAGGFGSTAQDISFPATQGFDVSNASTVGVTPAGSNRAGVDQFSSFMITGITADASAVTLTGRSAVARNTSLFNDVENVDASLDVTSNLIFITATPMRETLYHGWTTMIYDGTGVDGTIAEVTAANVIAQADFTEDSYSLGTQIATDPTMDVAADVSFMLAFPQMLAGTAAFAIINVGGEQAVEVTQMKNTVTIAGTPGVAADTIYDVFLVKSNGDYDSLDRINVQSLIVE